MQFPTDSLRGRSIIVTGAASGIGLALARALLRCGARVLAVDASAAGLDRFATEEAGNKDLRCMALQLGAPDTGERVAAEALAAFGCIDGLINNAGLGRHAIREDIYQRPLKFWETTPQMWERFVAVNSTAPFLLMRAVAPHMIARKSGRIINVTTSLSSMIGGGMSPYGPTKAAAEALAACAANDLQGTGVTVNVVVPGATTDTGMVPAHAPIVRENLARPEAMAPPVLWLLSDLGASTTGMRFRANLWDTAAPVQEAFAAAGQEVAWTSISRGQLVDLVKLKPQGDKA